MSQSVHTVRAIENVFVPMPDGRRLAARLWLPEGAPPAPAVLEALPYRKRDGTRVRDETIHPVLAAHGYPAVRVDVRGTGDSDGVLLDEYHAQEIDDLEAVLGWIAAQPWSDGRVVVMGKSWGGIAALMVATRRPAALAGVVSVCATDDRYGNDAHYMGGRLLAENLIWGVGLMAVAAHPPDPEIVGVGWRETWLERLHALEPFPALWMSHPTRDGYWQRDGASERAADITCPVFLMGGLEDPYASSIPRLLERLGGPRRALVGPWAHRYPHLGRPGPAVDFPRVLLGWLDEVRVGAVAEGPALVVWRTEGARSASGEDREGGWVVEAVWPPPGVADATWFPSAGRLTDGPSPPRVLEIDGPIETGVEGGGWCRFGAGGEGPYDQRDDDTRSVVFDTDPLEGPLDLLGCARFQARRVSPLAAGLLAARLCEVFPDGRSERLAYGFLDLGRVGGEEVVVEMEFACHRLRPGSRLRLALANACWPTAWPMPDDGPVRLALEGCALHVPVRAVPSGEVGGGGADHPPPAEQETVEDEGTFEQRLGRDDASGEITVESTSDLTPEGEVLSGCHEEIGLEHGHSVEETFRVRPGDPRSARGTVRHRVRLARGDWSVEISVTGQLAHEGGRPVFRGELEAREDGHVVLRRTW